MPAYPPAHDPGVSIVHAVERYYNAKGQVLLEYMSNEVMTRYRYNDENFRLERSKTEACVRTTAGKVIIFEAQTANPKQNLFYTYDKVGNVKKKENVGVTTDYDFEQEATYDSIYRLIKSEGLEANNPEINPPYQPNTPGGSGSRVGYEQEYTYDKIGNIQSLAHRGSSNFTREFEYLARTNQLKKVSIGGNDFYFTFDTCGNITSRELSTQYVYNQKGQIIFMKNQPAAGSAPTQVAMYTYNAAGQRTKKVVWKNYTYEVTLYLDGIWEKRYRFGGSKSEWQTYSHMVLDDKKLRSHREGSAMGDLPQADLWTLSDSVGSCTCTLDDAGLVVSVEGYYPFGETAWGSYARKRYRYCGKERDSETGLYYYGARYYDAWTCRFVSVDPLADKYAQLSTYNYADNSPITDYDIDGRQANETKGSEQGGQAASTGEPQRTRGNWIHQDSGEVVHDMALSDAEAKAQGYSFIYGSNQGDFGREPQDDTDPNTWGNQSTPVKTESKNSEHDQTEPKKHSNKQITKQAIALKNQVLDIPKAIDYLHKNALSASTGYCATFVRQALNAGGVRTPKNPKYARKYAAYLPKVGFTEVAPSDYKGNRFKAGDVAVIEGYPGGRGEKETGKAYGHIQMYDGKSWISDFKQPPGFYPGQNYRDSKPAYKIFRSNGK